MPFPILAAATLLAAHLSVTPAPAPANTVTLTTDARARAILDTAAARMGGIAALRAVKQLRVESVTEWQRLALDSRQYPTISSYERSVELRDYTIPAWRYSRSFLRAGGTSDLVDLVVDSVAAIQSAGKWKPQNVAYVDEREEWFTYSPERLMLLASDAADATALADTTITGTRYARVRATVGQFGATLHFAKPAGALAMVSFRHGQPRDFGLAPWGEMDVTVWYSQWRQVSPALSMPVQLDIYRVGKRYKRFTMLSAQVNPTIPADSLAMPDSLRAAFIAAGNKAMHDLPLDTARIANEKFAMFYTPGTPTGAIKVGGKWLMIEGGTAPLSMERSAAFLARADAATPVGGAIATQASGTGGIKWTIDQKLPVWVTASAKPYAEASMRGWNTVARFTPAPAASWIHIGTDSLRVESVDLPDYPDQAVLYVPSLKWAYVFNPTGIKPVSDLAKQRGWTVERIGSARDFVGVAPR